MSYVQSHLILSKHDLHIYFEISRTERQRLRLRCLEKCCSRKAFVMNFNEFVSIDLTYSSMHRPDKTRPTIRGRRPQLSRIDVLPSCTPSNCCTFCLNAARQSAGSSQNGESISCRRHRLSNVIMTRRYPRTASGGRLWEHQALQGVFGAAPGSSDRLVGLSERMWNVLVWYCQRRWSAVGWSGLEFRENTIRREV